MPLWRRSRRGDDLTWHATLTVVTRSLPPHESPARQDSAQDARAQIEQPSGNAAITVLTQSVTPLEQAATEPGEIELPTWQASLIVQTRSLPPGDPAQPSKPGASV